MSENKSVENYYQGIYLTETVLGNPNGDFVDNSPRNIDGKVFTTDKCIKYNIRKYMHETIENIDKKENVIFFYPRLTKEANKGEASYQTREDVFNNLFDKNFEDMIKNSPDVRMFGGTFSFEGGGSVYGPIQLTYGKDLNNAQIQRLQIGAPFSNNSGDQKTIGSEAVVDDAIISYDITINPNSHPELLKVEDLDLFKKSLWFGTNLRKSTSKKTDSKLLILIKFKNNKDNVIVNIGELKQLISISNKDERNNGEKFIKIDSTKLNKKLEKYSKFIESIDIYRDEDDIEIEFPNFEESDNDISVNYYEPIELLG
ncbi:MAG: type I CRISPR-associated protein Cas7 [Methanobacteriaceae archaeon]|nr:type I CRISPR-associated protein Cas7 [Candidatus Methanorudis spinitermitis]